MISIYFKSISSTGLTSLESFEGNKDGYTIIIKEDVFKYWYYLIVNEELDYKYISTFSNYGKYNSKEICIVEAKKYLTKIIKKHNPKVKYMRLTDFNIGDRVGFIEMNKTKLPQILEKTTGIVIGFTKSNVKVEVEIKTYHVSPSNLNKL